MVITGREIGRAITLALVESSAHVALLYELDDIAEVIGTKCNRKALVFSIDALDKSTITEAFTLTGNEFWKSERRELIPAPIRIT